MRLSKMMLEMNGSMKNVVCVDVPKKKEDEVKSTTVDRLHHIHVLDRSYSMSCELPGLIDDVKKTYDMMSDQDFISVIWFSGEEDCQILIKGSTKNNDDTFEKLMDTLKSPVSITCFSTPLKKVNEVIDDLAVVCPNFNVTFFTDGETVTSHSSSTEEKMIFEEIEKMKDRVLALNTIGYGQYYNQRLLEDMSSMTMYGKSFHSSNITDYSEVFSRTYEILSELVSDPIEVDTLKNDPEADIVYLSSNTTKMSTGHMKLTFTNKIKNQFFLVLDPEVKSFVINEVEYNVDDIKRKIIINTFKNFLYTYGHELFYNGRGNEALYVYTNENVLDKYNVDSILSAFTNDERAELQKHLRKNIFNNRSRMKDGQCTTDYVPAKDAFCVMDLLQVLAKGKNFYVPVENYQRIGEKTNDNFNLFKADKSQEIKTSFENLVFNEKHLNISIRYQVTGHVKLNPRQAKEVELSEIVDSRIYRNQTIIKDGSLNITKFSAYLENDTISQLSKVIANKAKLKMTVSRTKKSKENLKLVKFDITELPVINQMYSEEANDLDAILTTVQNIEYQKASIKVYNELAKRKLANNPAVGVYGEKGLTSEQINILKQHGVNSKFDYQGIDVKKEEKETKDSYMTRLFEIKLKGWSSLPKVSDVEAKVAGNKKLNAPAQAMATILSNYEELGGADMTYDQVQQFLTQMKELKMSLTIKLNTLKLAKTLTGSFWNNLEVDTKGNYIYKDLIIKNERVEKFF